MSIARVVLADDHQAIRNGVRGLLERHGIEVVGETGYGEEAVQLVKQLSPDVLILDLRMPGLGGLEVVKQLKAENLPVRILILSVYLEKRMIKRLFKLEVDGYVSKDEALEWLIPAVETILKGERCFSPNVAEKLPGITPEQSNPSLSGVT